MPDYSEEITRLEAIVNSGLSEVSTDGSRARYDIAEARKRLAELRTLQGEGQSRPRVARLNLENTW